MMKCFNRYQIEIFVALCFKYLVRREGAIQRNPCLPTVDKKYIAAVDELYIEYNKKIASDNLRTQFILDESGTSGMNRQCLQEKWELWPYTYISSRDPLEIMKSNNKRKVTNFSLMYCRAITDSSI